MEKKQNKTDKAGKTAASQTKLIDDYIAQFPAEEKARLIELRNLIGELLPEAEERISYNMPSFYQNGTVVYYAGFRNHIGFYPTASGIANFEAELKPYKHSKGAVQFKIEEELPVSLIRKIVEFRLRENLAKTKGP